MYEIAKSLELVEVEVYSCLYFSPIFICTKLWFCAMLYVRVKRDIAYLPSLSKNNSIIFYEVIKYCTS